MRNIFEFRIVNSTISAQPFNLNQHLKHKFVNIFIMITFRMQTFHACLRTIT